MGASGKEKRARGGPARLSRRAARWAVLGTIILGVGWLMLSRLEGAFLYVPDRTLVSDPSSIGLAYDDVNIRAEDGPVLHGWWVPGEGSDLTVLWFHGNAGNISTRLTRIALFHDLGADQFVIDYRGYGRSEGKPSEAGLYLDADAAYRYLREGRGVSPDRIVVCGQSLGAAVAADLAARKEIAGVIIESPFTSIREMARRVFPYLPASLIVRSSFEVPAKIRRVTAPLLVIHGAEDTLVPPEMGRRVFEAATCEKELFLVPGAGHNSMLSRGGDAYRDRLRAFLDRLGPSSR